MTRKVSDMSPNEIRIALLRQGVTQSEIARKMGVSAQAVYQVLDGRNVSHRIRVAIAKACDLDIKRIWPSTYLYGGGPLKPGRQPARGTRKVA